MLRQQYDNLSNKLNKRAGMSCIECASTVGHSILKLTCVFATGVFVAFLMLLSGCDYDFAAKNYNLGEESNGNSPSTLSQSLELSNSTEQTPRQLVPATPEKFKAVLKAGVEQRYQDALCDDPMHAYEGIQTIGGAPMSDNALNSESGDLALSAPSVGVDGGGSSGGGFSTTNLQEEGVDEADLVKFDGRYLYIAEQPEYDFLMPVDGVIEVDPLIDVDDGTNGSGEVLELDAFAGSEVVMSLDEPVDSVDNSMSAGGSAGSGSAGSGSASTAVSVSSARLSIAPNTQPESQAPTIRVMAVDADPASASEVGRITLDDNNTTIQGLYLAEKINNEQLLSVVSSENYYHIYYDDVIFEAPVEAPFIETDGGEASSSETSSAGSGVAVSRAEGAAVLQDYHQNRTILSTYRVNNPAQVTEAWKLAIEGQYISSRVVNNTLFVVTSFYPMDEVPPLMATFDQASDVPIEALLPDQVYNDAEVDKLISENDCFVPDTYDSSNKYAQLVTITAVPLADPDARASACMLGNSYELYASTESMYLIEQHYPENFDIHKFAISDGFPVYHASTSLSGHVGFNNPAFRLSESGDYLRVVHTEQSDGERRFAHRLTILKEANDGAARFDVVADIPNSNRPSAIGKPNEDIYAVRYVGDMAYVVTFQRTDPLYAINLTSPEDPFIAGSVEIPGFADYLHPIGSNLLLGVGRQASDEGRQQGIKVSLFDVSNPAAPREVDRQVYGNQYSNSPLEYDAKALSELFHVDTQTHRITIPMSVTGAQQGENTSDEFKADYHWLYDGLELLEVNSEAKTLTAVGTLKSYSSENEAERRWGHIQRGLLMGESVHFVYGNHVWSSQWNNPISSTGAQ